MESLLDLWSNFVEKWVPYVARIESSEFFIGFGARLGALPEHRICNPYAPVQSKHTSLFSDLCPKKHHFGINFGVILETISTLWDPLAPILEAPVGL